MAMTPRRVFGCLRLAAKRKAAEDVRLFAIVRAAVNADKGQADKFLAALQGGADG